MSNRRKAVRRSPEQWQSIIEQQEASDLSAPQYCRHTGIAYQSFAHWRNKLSAASALSPTASFIELTPDAVVQPENPVWHIELDLAPGVQLRIAR